MPRQNQHYVPRCLLRPFASNKSEQIHVLDKSDGREFVTSIGNIAAEIGFNDFVVEGQRKSIETFLSRMESDVATLLQAVVAKESINWLTRENRIVVSLFAAIQQLRVKCAREEMQNLHRTLREWIVERGHNPNSVEGFEELNDEEMRAAGVGLVIDAKDFAKYYFHKQWVLMKSPPGQSLYISDNPITMHNLVERPGRGNLGLNVEGIEIYLPIAPALSLCFFCERTSQRVRAALHTAHWLRGFTGRLSVDIAPLEELDRAFRTGEPLKLLPANVEHQNSLQVIDSSRFVFSHDGNFSMANEMLADHQSLKMPRAFRQERKTGT